MSVFCILNLIFSVGTSFWLARIYFKERYLFVKPSIILLTYTHIFFQWPMTLLPEYCEHSLKNPYILSFLINGYMLGGLLISPLILREKAQIIWNKLDSKSILLNSDYYYLIIFSLFIVFLTYIGYIMCIPFNKTGLYALFFNTAEASIARENSLKLLDSTMIKYAYSMVRSSIIPIIFSLLFLQIINKRFDSYYNYIVIFFEILILILCVVFSSLTGQKSFVAGLIFLGGLTMLWKNKLKFQPVKILLIILFATMPSLVFSFIREGGTFKEFNFTLYLHYFFAILERFFIIPFKVGLWYVRYAQDVGPFGIAAFGKLSKIFGISPLNAPNIVGLKYAPEFYASKGAPLVVVLTQYILDIFNALNHSISLAVEVPLRSPGNNPPMIKLIGHKHPIESLHFDEARKNISAGAGYLLSYYGYLGILSFPLSLLGLFVLDSALFVYIKIKDILLVPCLASISLTCLVFVQTDYTVACVTHGYAVILLIVLGLSNALDFTNKQFVWRSMAYIKRTNLIVSKLNNKT